MYYDTIRIVEFSGLISPYEMFSVYLCDAEVDADRPIINEDGRIIFFSSLERLEFAIEQAVPGDRKVISNISMINPEPLEMYTNETIEIILNADIDDRAYIIDFLNFLFDYSKVTNVEPPLEVTRREGLLGELANHTTFDRNIGDFFRRYPKGTRKKCVDAIYWHLGVIFANAMFIP